MDAMYTKDESQPIRSTMRLKNDNEKVEELKQNFAGNARKLDFLKKSDGYNYCIGSIGLTEDSTEYRIWKTYDVVSTSKNAEYLFKSFDKEETFNKFNEITG
jgi:hypothetical protein